MNECTFVTVRGRDGCSEHPSSPFGSPMSAGATCSSHECGHLVDQSGVHDKLTWQTTTWQKGLNGKTAILATKGVAEKVMHTVSYMCDRVDQVPLFPYNRGWETQHKEFRP